MPTDATLTKVEKNRILALVIEYGPPPSDFGWSERQTEELTYTDGSASYIKYTVSVLTHRSTGYHCIFGARSFIVSPGLTTKVETFDHRDDWVRKDNICGKWLVVLKEEVDTPDLWAIIGQEKALSTAAASATLDNDPFAAAERGFIAAKLDGIKGYLLESQQFAADQAEHVEREFAYLRQSSERLGRKDWLNVLIGGLVSLAISLALDPEKTRGLLRLAGEVFQSLWGTGHQLLP